MEQTEQKHSKLPWKVGDYDRCWVQGQNSIGIACLRHTDGQPRDHAEANAAYIVKCVNSHAQLVAALTACRSALELMINPLDEEERNQPVFLRLRVAKEMARVALSAATKEDNK